MGCLSRTGLGVSTLFRRAHSPSTTRSRPQLLPKRCMSQSSGVLYHVHDGSSPLLLDMAPGRGFTCINVQVTSPGEAAARVAPAAPSTAVAVIVSAGTWVQKQLVALLATLSNRHPWAFLVLWHPSATEDPALRLAAWAAGAHMVTSDLVALGAALATAAASRTPPTQPLTHVTDMRLQDGLDWFQLQQQQQPAAADAASNTNSNSGSAHIQATPSAAGGRVGGGCSCPWCGLPGLSPAGLWYHVPLHHCYHDNLGGQCPVCNHTTDNLAVHIHERHHPFPHTPEVRTGVYALVVVRRPSDGAFLMVQEFAQQGYWVPGGGVDTGEGLRAAALRETREEAGVEVELKGVLQVSWGHRYRYRRVIFYAEPVGDAGPHLQEGAATAAAAAATAVGLTGGVSSSSRAVDGLEQASKAEAAAAGGAVAGHGAGDLVCPGRVVPHHVAPTLPQAVALAQQQLQQRGAAGGDGGRPSAPAVVPKTLPDFESAGACWVRLEDLGRVPLRSKEVPLTWFPHVAAGGAMEPMVQPECWQQVFEGWEW